MRTVETHELEVFEPIINRLDQTVHLPMEKKGVILPVAHTLMVKEFTLITDRRKNTKTDDGMIHEFWFDLPDKKLHIRVTNTHPPQWKSK